MEHLRRTAFQSIGRACGFAGLAVLCVMVGLSYDPVAAAKAGGILTMIMTLVLVIKARAAAYQDYRRTELWAMLDKADRPPATIAQWASATILREAYLWFARYCAAVTVCLWAAALVLSLAGIGAAP